MPLWSRTESAVSPAQEVARVAEVSGVHAAFEWFRRHERELSELQLELAAIPAPPFGEQKRAEWLQRQFTSVGLEDAHTDEIGNVIARYPGGDPAATAVALSAHIDTVFPVGTPVEPHRERDKLYGPGVSDNASGVVALLAIAQALRQAQVRTTAPILFIGNVGEEGEGDLRGMRHIFADPQWRDAIQYAIIVDGASSDTIVTRALGSRRYEITLRGPGGHSWSDFGAPNPIVALASAIDAFSRVDVPSSPKTTFNVGIIHGGTSVNSIPESATMRVDLRSSSAQEIDRLEEALRQAIARAVARAAHNGFPPHQAKNGLGGDPGFAGELTHEIRLIGSRPAGEVPEQARIVQIARAVDQHLQNNSHLQRASTDANIPISMGLEAIALGAGGTGGGAHTLHEWYDPRGRDLGLKRVLLTALALAGISG